MKSNLKKFRKENGLSLQALGDMCGMSKSHIHDLEKEEGSTPKLSNAYAISKVLGKNVYDVWPDQTEIVEETVILRRISTKKGKYYE